MSERAIVLRDAENEERVNGLHFRDAKRSRRLGCKKSARKCGHLRLLPCGDDGAVEGTRKEQSDGIAIVAQSADRVSHRERVPSRQRETPHSIWGVALVQSKGLEPIRFPIGT